MTPVRFASFAGAMLVCAAAAPLAAAQEDTFAQTYFFGDAYTDSGFYRPLLPASVRPVTGQFTTNPGFVWSEYFAERYGTSALPNGNGQTGTNYAAGGARVATNGAGALGPIPSLTTQVNGYLALNGGRADPNALYTVFGGAGDLFTITFSFADPVTTISGAVNGMTNIVSSLSGAGARYILVGAAPDLGLSPALVALGAPAAAQATAASAGYSQALFASLASNGLRVIPLDILTFSRELVAEAAAFGFTNTAGTACQPQITANSLTCNPTSVVNPNARNTYLYADGTYYTSRAQDIIAQYASSLIEGPRQIAQLPLSASLSGLMRTERVLAAFATRAEGETGWWIDVRGEVQNDGWDIRISGEGGALTAGYDLARGPFLFGVFAAYGQGDYDFARGWSSGGSFDQREATAGGYAGWRSGPAFVHVQASYTALEFDVERTVALAGRISTGNVIAPPFFVLSDETLGGVTRTHAGDTEGGVVALGLNAGWRYTSGDVTHGPVVGVLAQFIDIDGYTESNPALATALGYPDQSYDSLVGGFGWQAEWRATETLTPYAKAIYQQEFRAAPDEAFARALSVPGSLDYAAPGVVLDREFVTATLGARAELFGLDADIGVTAVLDRGQSTDATVFVRLSKSL